MSSIDPLSCALEALMALRRRGLYPNEVLIAKELDESPYKVRQIMEDALKQGLVTKKNGYYEITDEGFKRVLKHRELYVHDFFVHGDNRWSKSITDWGRHWRRRHGLTRDVLNKFYRVLADLDGRVEELIPLTELKPGEKGIVVSAVGGFGAARRLAEMGLTPGVQIEVVRRAPLRGPIEIEVRGTRLVLGFGLASRIAVKKV